MDRDAHRPRLIQLLTTALTNQPWVLAAWLAGSDSNRRTDQWSDIDLMMIVEDDKVEDAFALCKAAISTHAPVSLELRMPAPVWHGHDQVFWQLEGVPDWLMIDMLVMRKSSTASRFLEAERHGTPQVLFDRAGLVRAAPIERAAHVAKVRARLDALIPRFRLLQHLVRKSVWRGDAAEASDRFMSYTLRPLVDLMRIRHCPDCFDYGMRYLRDDLPADAWKSVESLALPGSLEQVLHAQKRAEELFEILVKDLNSNPRPTPR